MTILALRGVCVFTLGTLAHAVATISLDPTTRYTVGGVATLDRLQFFNGHWGTGNVVSWRPQDLAQFGPEGYRAHPGRSFYVSARMAQVGEDTARPGFVDVSSLIKSCKTPTQVLWNVSEIDNQHSIFGPRFGGRKSR